MRQLLRGAGLPALALVAVPFAAGCFKGGPPEYHLSGSVTFQGKPVPAGQLFFDPDYARGNDGPAGFAYIKDGRYDTRAGGKGVVGGPHTVRIHGADGKPDAELPVGRPLFREYAAKAALPRQDGTHDFDVPASARR